MSREHGTKACYVFGPQGRDTSRGCHCPECTRANREEIRNRTRLKAYGRWQPYIDAGPSREHLKMLAGHGIGWQRAAVLAGIGNGTAGRILYGAGGRPPTQRVRPETEAAILAVRPSLDLVADSAPVDGTGTVRRLQALAAAGWTNAEIARRLGTSRECVSQLLHRRPRVTAATARAVRDLYGQLWDQPPPERTRRDEIAADRARRGAASRGWPVPAAWDEDIDDPEAGPAEGWRRPAGRKQRDGAELAAEARDLFGFGLTRVQAAERLGVSRDALDHALIRHPEEEAEAA